MENQKRIDDRRFLAWLTLALIAASLWIFRSYLHFLLVAAVLALATSHVFSALVERIASSRKTGFLYNAREGISAFLLTCFFLLLIFGPLIYFVSMTYGQISGLDVANIKKTLSEIITKVSTYLETVPLLDEPLQRLKTEGLTFITGPAMDVALNSTKGLLAGVGNLLVQITWILLFYFLFNLYGRQILVFIGNLLPMSDEHERYLYRECTGTVAVVFYGTLFNMVIQGIAFGLLIAIMGGYNPTYLGVLAGFCSVIPLVGAALVYVPVAVLELLAGNILHAVIVVLFAWVVMGFLIDNIMRMFFIGYLKNAFGFQYRMNEILILLAILAGISAFGFWGLIIGPSVLALTLAAANLYSRGISQTD